MVIFYIPNCQIWLPYCQGNPMMSLLGKLLLFVQISHSVKVVDVGWFSLRNFGWFWLVFKTNFHPDSYWTLSGLRKKWITVPYIGSMMFMHMLRWWCSLNMPRMFLLCYVHAYWVGGLSMPSDGCSVHMPITIINSKLRDAIQDSVPYMVKVILTHILVECGIVDPYTDTFFNGSG